MRHNRSETKLANAIANIIQVGIDNDDQSSHIAIKVLQMLQQGNYLQSDYPLTMEEL